MTAKSTIYALALFAYGCVSRALPISEPSTLTDGASGDFKDALDGASDASPLVDLAGSDLSCSRPLCAGGCIDFTSDPAHCGNCGHVCGGAANAVATCVQSTCGFSCSTGFADCDGNAANGCEASLSSISHCGSCLHGCAGGTHASPACMNQTCGFACISGWGDCDASPFNGCETDLTTLTNCGTCGNACVNNLNTSLIGYWKFDEGSGTNAADSSTSGNNATLNPGATWTGGKKGNALRLNGTTGYALTAQRVQISETAYSISAWFKTTSAANQIIFANRGVLGTSGKSLTLAMGHSDAATVPPGHLAWLIDLDGWGIGIQSGSAYNDGTWHQVVATWAASSGTAVDYAQFKLYVDGAALNTSTLTLNCDCGGVNSPLSGSEAAQIGASLPWMQFWNGTLDEVGVWSRQLSSSEASTLYNSGSGISTPFIGVCQAGHCQ